VYFILFVTVGTVMWKCQPSLLVSQVCCHFFNAVVLSNVINIVQLHAYIDVDGSAQSGIFGQLIRGVPSVIMLQTSVGRYPYHGCTSFYSAYALPEANQ